MDALTRTPPSLPKRLFKPTRLRSESGEHQTESVTGKAYADYIVQQCSRTEGPAVAPPLPNERVGGGGSLDDCAVTKPEIKDVPMDGSTCRGTDLLSELPGTSEVPATRGLGQNASDGPSGVIPRAVGKTNSLLVNPRQRGNPVLKHFRNVPWEFSDIVPDYVMGQTSCTLFLRYGCLCMVIGVVLFTVSIGVQVFQRGLIVYIVTLAYNGVLV
uniref:ERCC1-like central domain-containing protein n=1 Tax=Eptatretus burgeri TaxID=7764 RepID=A0A8C4QE51_EPTBU